MKITLNTIEIQEVIKKAQKAIPKKSSLKILSNVKISALNDKITLTVTDIDTTIFFDLTGYIAGQGEILLNPETLKLIAKLKNTYEITIENDKITAGNKVLKYSNQDPEEYPKMEYDCDNQAFTISQKNLIDAFSVSYCSGYEMNIPIFCGVYINKDHFVATDTHRLAWKKVDIENTMEQGVVINNNAVKLLTGTLLNKKSDTIVTVKYDKGYKHIKFQSDNITIITRLIGGQYVNYKQVIPKQHKTAIKINVQNILDELEFINEICKKNHGITFAVDKNNMYIDAADDRNAVTLTIPCLEMIGEEIECMGIDYIFLVDALKNCEQEELEIKFNDKYNPILFSNNSLVCPLRVDERLNAA